MTTSGASIPAFFDADTGKITHLRRDRFIIPSICAPIQVLQLTADLDCTAASEYAQIAKTLIEIAGAYPLLEVIEICAPPGGMAHDLLQQKVEECLGEEVVKSKLLWTTAWQYELPGYVDTTVSFVLSPST
jgi:hypothetical protein